MSPECGAPHENADLTGLYCQLPEGHSGEHECLVPITWPATSLEDDRES